MDNSGPDPLLYLHSLADRHGNFAALRLVIGGGPSPSLLALTEHEDFLSLSGGFPCLFDATQVDLLSPELGSALVLAGCRPIAHERMGLSESTFDLSYTANFDWIDGNCYMTPPAKPIGNQAASRALALQLVQLVAADAENRDIEAIFRRDPALSYQLLRLVNSLAFGAGRRITSFSQALVMLGRKQLRRWLNLMAFASRDGDKRQTMLLAKVAVRARCMELLAHASGLDYTMQDQAFMVGMFSLLGALFGAPIADVLRPLTISDAMRAAVLSYEGELGYLLNLLEKAECGDFPALHEALCSLQVAPEDFNLFVVQACNWMLGVISDSRGDGHA
jgi:c-di-GMP-related signal transduction protein